MKTIEVKINENKYKCKLSFRTYVKYEDIFKESLDNAIGLKGIIKMFYACLIANNENEFNYSFEEFFDVIDDNPEAIQEFTELLTSLAKDNDVKKKM